MYEDILIIATSLTLLLTLLYLTVQIIDWVIRTVYRTLFAKRKVKNKQEDAFLNEDEEETIKPIAATPASSQHKEKTPQREAPHANIQDEKTYHHTSAQSNGRLALFLFLGSFLGSLIGVAADFNDAKELFVDVVASFDPSPTINIVGSDTILGEKLHMANEWKKDFVELTKWKQHVFFQEITRQVDVNIKPIGSHSGFEQAKQGKVHILAMSDPMSAHQQQQLKENGVNIHCAAEIGYDIVVFVTDLNNNIPAFSRYALRNILRGFFVDWSQISDRAEKSQKIQILARKGSGTTHFILDNFLNDDRFLSHFLTCESNEICLDTTLSMPGSIYWSSAAWLYTQPLQYVHPLLIQREDNLLPQNPLSDKFDVNNYPTEMMRGLYMYVLNSDQIEPHSLELAKQFFQYVRGIHGQEILEKSKFYTYLKPPKEVELVLPDGFGKQISNELPVVCKTG